MLLSEQTVGLLASRFVDKPFRVPSPGSGIDALWHAEAMSKLAAELVGEHPLQAIELQEYARQIHEMAGTWAILQQLPIAMLAAYANTDPQPKHPLTNAPHPAQ